MKKFVTEDSFWEIFPEAAIGVLTVEGVQENAALDEVQAAEVKNLLDRANEAARGFLTSEVISENHVVEVWRKAYQRFPTKRAPGAPSRPCSSGCSTAARWGPSPPLWTSPTRCP